MRASTFVVAFAASAFAAGVDSTDKFDEITAPQEKAVADGKPSVLETLRRSNTNESSASSADVTSAVASAAAGHLHGADDEAPSTPAGRRTDGCSARAGPRRCNQIGVAGRLEQELTAQAHLLRVRQQRAVAGSRGGAQ